jgi:hypothetical protein
MKLKCYICYGCHCYYGDKVININNIIIMSYKLISKKAPVRPKIAQGLRMLTVDGGAMVFPYTDRESVASTMTRLKRKEGMEFTAERSGDDLNVWRIS